MAVKHHPRVAWRSASFAVALSTACCLVGSATAAPAEPAGNVYYELRVQHSDKCLDVAHRATHHGAHVVQADCSKGTNQAWKVEPLGGDQFRVKAMHSDLCLDVAHASRHHGAKVLQATCSGGDNQAWGFYGAGYERRSDGNEMPKVHYNYKLQAKHSGHCLDVANGSIAHGVSVVQGRCWAPGHNQEWRLVPRYS
ncbi:RICIN domain-containing protein [Streptomyces phaeoluteigriseus]